MFLTFKIQIFSLSTIKLLPKKKKKNIKLKKREREELSEDRGESRLKNKIKNKKQQLSNEFLASLKIWRTNWPLDTTITYENE